MYLCTRNYDLKRGGTFETAKAGTFHSVTAGTLIPLSPHNWRTLGDLFVEGATVEVFVVRGGLNEREAIFSMLCDGLLDDDIAMLRQAVTKEEVFKRWEGSK